MRIEPFSLLALAAAAILVSMAVTPSLAQVPAPGAGQEQPLRKVTVTPSGGAQRLAISVPGRLMPGDELVLWSPSRRLRAALVTPDGQRIEEAGAAQASLDWLASSPLVDAAGADAPLSISVRFQSIQPGGEYAFEITPEELPRPVELTLALRTQAAPPAPGMVVRGPVKASPQARLEWLVPQDEDGAAVDVVVSDPDARVTLHGPNGLTLTAANARERGARWRITDQPQQLDAPGGMFDLSGFYLPVQGLHHLISFARMPRGAYAVSVESELGSEVHLAFLATGRLMHAAYDVIERSSQPNIAEVKMAIEPIADPVHIGDPVPLHVDFSGEPVRRPVRFLVRLEYRPQPGEAPVAVRELQPQFAWSLDGLHRSYFQPEREGLVRVTVRAEGQTVAGLPFVKEAQTPELRVRPLAARFLGFWEQPTDADGNRLLDYLDLHNELEVSRAGQYRIRFQFTAPNKRSVTGEAAAALGAGRQRLTVRFSAAQLRSLGADGPYRVHDIELVMLEDGQPADRVNTTGMQMLTTNYRLLQFEP